MSTHLLIFAPAELHRVASIGDLSRAIIAAGRDEIALPPELAKKRWLIEF